MDLNQGIDSNETSINIEVKSPSLQSIGPWLYTWITKHNFYIYRKRKELYYYCPLFRKQRNFIHLKAACKLAFLLQFDDSCLIILPVREHLHSGETEIVSLTTGNHGSNDPEIAWTCLIVNQLNVNRKPCLRIQLDFIPPLS